MSPSLSLELAISMLLAFGAYTASIIGLVLWLTSKFRALEVLIYKEMNVLKEEYRDEMVDIKRRVFRMEIAIFGVTTTGREVD